jgi:putative transcriptional regulator
MNKSEKISKSIGDKLKKLRSNEKISQAKLADLAGLSRRTIINIEKGKMTMLNFLKVVGCLGGNAEKIFSEI